MNRILDKDGRDVTAERTYTIPAGRTTQEKHEGEWEHVTPDEREVLRLYRAARASQAAGETPS